MLLSFQAQQELQQRLKDMIALESELVNRDIQITVLQDELSSSKIELAQVATAHLEELNVLLREHDAAVDKLSDAKEEIHKLRERLDARDADVKVSWQRDKRLALLAAFSSKTARTRNT